MFGTAARFARTRLGASLAAGATAATVHLVSDEKRKSRCSSQTELLVGELEKLRKEKARGAGKRSHPARSITTEVTGTAAQRAFFSKEMTVMGLPLRASRAVSDGALYVAADRISRMLREQPAAVLERLAQCGACVHIIGEHQGTSDLPEHRHMKGVDGGYTGEKGVTLDQRARGMGGLQTSCGEENLLDLDSDPRYAGRDILTHEFAHLLVRCGHGAHGVSLLRGWPPPGRCPEAAAEAPCLPVRSADGLRAAARAARRDPRDAQARDREHAPLAAGGRPARVRRE
jgi:hypothetical protein